MLFRSIVKGLVAQGVLQLMIAGGETSGACVQALGIKALQIGPEVAPGVPWCFSPSLNGEKALHVLLKSGNFGQENIFSAGFDVLD